VSDDSTETEIEATAEAEAEAPAADATEAVADEAPAEAVADEAVAEADLPEVAGESAESGEAAEVYDAPAATATIVQDGPTVARVYICKHGHRTISLWQVPETCLRRVKGHICGEATVPLADAPADAKEKMLNPLKASKKAAKKS
jgi:hypothetical protein